MTSITAHAREAGDSRNDRVTQLSAPRTFQGSWIEASEFAADQLEPVFVPVPIHADDRGWSMMNLLVGVLDQRGQVNFSVQYPGAVKAWHRHQLQSDYWTCVQGQLKAGVYREADGRAWVQVMGEHKPGVLIIPPPLWHGATALGSAPAGLLYYVTHAYNQNAPDEERRAHDSIKGFPWEVRHG
jgi:dTDP-4-dehydrorhamnose 3,5-epimerase